MTDIFTEKNFLRLLFGALCENGEVWFADEICVEEDVGFRGFLYIFAKLLYNT